MHRVWIGVDSGVSVKKLRPKVCTHDLPMPRIKSLLAIALLLSTQGSAAAAA